MENRFVKMRLSNLPLKEGLVSYFDSHKRDFNKLNNKEAIIVPFSVYVEINKYVATRFMNNVPSPIKVKEEKEAVEEITKSEISEPESELEPELKEDSISLFDKLVAINGIGVKTATVICEKCDNDVSKLKENIDNLDIREDIVSKIKENL